MADNQEQTNQEQRSNEGSGNQPMSQEVLRQMTERLTMLELKLTQMNAQGSPEVESPEVLKKKRFDNLRRNTSYLKRKAEKYNEGEDGSEGRVSTHKIGIGASDMKYLRFNGNNYHTWSFNILNRLQLIEDAKLLVLGC